MADDDNPITPPATGEPAPPATPPAAPPGDGSADLGDAGKKALAEERKARRDAETRLKELEPLAAKAKKLEEASKTESEKLTERATAAEKRAVEAESRALRLEVATAKGLTPAQAKRLVGSTKEELEADADELLSSFGGSTGTGGKGGAGKKPVEQLRPGGLPNPPEPSVADLIVAAEKAKDWGKAQALKAQQLMQLANPNQ